MSHHSQLGQTEAVGSSTDAITQLDPIQGRRQPLEGWRCSLWPVGMAIIRSLVELCLFLFSLLVRDRRIRGQLVTPHVLAPC